MGIIQKQATRNTFISYIGLILGYVNIIILFPTYFTEEEFGLIQLMMSIAIIYTQFSALGLVSIIVRFFPFFKSEDKKHQGFISWVTLIAIAGFIIVTLLYIIFQPLIVDAYLEKSKLFLEYYHFVIPLAFFILMYSVFESITRSVHKTVFSAFLRDVGFRLLVTIGIFLFYLKYLTYEQFIIYYFLGFALISFLLLLQIIFIKQFKFFIDFKSIKFSKVREILKYGLFTLLAGSSYFLAQNIDKIMLGSLVGLEVVAVYAVFMYIATVIAFPARSLYRIAVPVITECWKNNDTKQIYELYKRISLILMILGSIIYIGILVNMDNLLYFLHPDYRYGFMFFVFLGLSFLIDITGGINSDIISTSKFFRYDTLFNVIYMVFCVGLNLIFIPLYGGMGAAIATALSMTTFNFMKWLFLKVKYNMQPFGLKNLIVILIAFVSLVVGWYLPVIVNVYVDILYRSSITAGIYFTLVYMFRLSDDVNERIRLYLSKLTIKT